MRHSPGAGGGLPPHCAITPFSPAGTQEPCCALLHVFGTEHARVHTPHRHLLPVAHCASSRHASSQLVWLSPSCPVGFEEQPNSNAPSSSAPNPFNKTRAAVIRSPVHPSGFDRNKSSPGKSISRGAFGCTRPLRPTATRPDVAPSQATAGPHARAGARATDRTKAWCRQSHPRQLRRAYHPRPWLLAL